MDEFCLVEHLLAAANHGYFAMPVRSRRAARRLLAVGTWVLIGVAGAYALVARADDATPCARTSASAQRKAAPDTDMQPDGARLEAVIRDRYPRLVTERITGMPLVTVLLNPDGTLAGANLEVLHLAPGPLSVSELQFARFGLSAGDLRYIGVARIRLPLNTVLVVFGGRDSLQLARDSWTRELCQ